LQAGRVETTLTAIGTSRVKRDCKWTASYFGFFFFFTCLGFPMDAILSVYRGKFSLNVVAKLA
jgi:hypothetical protein